MKWGILPFVDLYRSVSLAVGSEHISLSSSAFNVHSEHVNAS